MSAWRGFVKATKRRFGAGSNTANGLPPRTPASSAKSSLPGRATTLPARTGPTNPPFVDVHPAQIPLNGSTESAAPRRADLVIPDPEPGATVQLPQPTVELPSGSPEIAPTAMTGRTAAAPQSPLVLDVPRPVQLRDAATPVLPVTGPAGHAGAPTLTSPGVSPLLAPRSLSAGNTDEVAPAVRGTVPPAIAAEAARSPAEQRSSAKSAAKSGIQHPTAASGRPHHQPQEGKSDIYPSRPNAAAKPPHAGETTRAATAQASLPIPGLGRLDRRSQHMQYEMNRRLSLDGDLPDAAKRPDAKDQRPDDDSQFPDARAATAGAIGATDDPREPIAGALSLNRAGDIPAEAAVDVDFAKCPRVLYDVAGCSKAGWEPARAPQTSTGAAVEVRKENQDAYCVFGPFANSNDQVLLGVFDGHGSEGRAIAHYVRDEVSSITSRLGSASDEIKTMATDAAGRPAVLPERLHKAVAVILKSAFSRAERGLTESDDRMDHVFSGTTAVVSWFIGDRIYTAWAGDSRAVMGRTTSAGLPSAPQLGSDETDGRANGTTASRLTRFRAVELSHDQKPVRVDEKKRVKAAGGRIARWRRNIGPLRVWLPKDWIPGLAMTRSIGDTVLSEYGVSPIPEVTHVKLQPGDAFIVLASDGVWEFMNSQEVVDFVGRMRREGKSATAAADGLVREAVRRWRRNEDVVDDTTAVIMWIDPSGRSGGHIMGQASAGAVGATSDTTGGTTPPAPTKKKPTRRFALARSQSTSLSMGHDKQDGVSLVLEDGRLSNFVCKNDISAAI